MFLTSGLRTLPTNDAVAIVSNTTSTTTLWRITALALFDHYLLVSLEAEQRLVDGIRILPWDVFLDELWDRACWLGCKMPRD